MRYAAQTTVSPERSRGEIERILERYGARKFMYGTDQKEAMIAFEFNGRAIRMTLPMPTMEEVSKTPKGRTRRGTVVNTELDRARRQRWRALRTVILAKLEAVESGISSFEEEFLSWTILANGNTVYEQLKPQMDLAIRAGTMPKLLLPGSDRMAP